MKKIFFILSAMVITCSMQAKSLTLDWANPLNPESFVYDDASVWTGTYNEDDYETIDFNGISFAHQAIADWDFWYGFTVAKSADTTFSATADQFHCVAGGGLAGKGTPYILAYPAEGMGPSSPCEVYFTADSDPWIAQEVYLCIGSWALDNVLKGGAPARAFDAGDSLVIEIEGLDDSYDLIEGKKVTFFLADYRSSNSADWHVNRGWEKCDLSALGEVYGLVFTMKSSDKSGSYANTALYFALDGLKLVRPEIVADFENEVGGINVAKADTCWQGADAPALGWNTWNSGTYTFQTYYGGNSGYGEYYSAFTVTNETANTSTGSAEPYRSAKGGAYEGENFAVWNMNYYGVDTIHFALQEVPGFFINNTAYAVTSMVNGDSFAKAFGPSDFFKLICIGVKDGAEVETKEVYLANNNQYIVDWTYVDLSELGEIDGLTFSMESSDSGDWGMNTPAYFCMDNFGAAKPAGYVDPAKATFPERTSINAIKANEQVTKIIRNGQVLIIRDNHIYNLLGYEVK